MIFQRREYISPMLLSTGGESLSGLVGSLDSFLKMATRVVDIMNVIPQK